MDLLVCLDCGYIFETPQHYTDTHGMDTPPYEHFTGCPKCSGAYTQARECDCCHKWIRGEYVAISNGDRFCEDCFTKCNLGDEEDDEN
jgi:hypothetical protein